MLYYLSFPLSMTYSGFNVFRYITFRAAMAALLALLISFLLGPWLIRTLTEKQIGQQIRDDGPASHAVKAGTPTMLSPRRSVRGPCGSATISRSCASQPGRCDRRFSAA